MAKRSAKSKGSTRKPKPIRIIRAGDLLDLERPEGGNNRQLLGMLATAFNKGHIDLMSVDYADLSREVAKLTRSRNDRVKMRALELQTAMAKLNHATILAAERLAQGERQSDRRDTYWRGTNEVDATAPAKDDEGPRPLVIVHELAPVPQLPPGAKRG